MNALSAAANSVGTLRRAAGRSQPEITRSIGTGAGHALGMIRRAGTLAGSLIGFAASQRLARNAGMEVGERAWITVAGLYGGSAVGGGLASLIAGALERTVGAAAAVSRSVR